MLKICIKQNVKQWAPTSIFRMKIRYRILRKRTDLKLLDIKGCSFQKKDWLTIFLPLSANLQKTKFLLILEVVYACNDTMIYAQIQTFYALFTWDAN